ncbi:hypothetical protein AK830_g7748 [Neonectria ditissima]|uniref:Enoyl reductase (ER) domain-containing protein n=1 Tax=Neonectria ditissima TaxID=78410 RepID=A0A0P7BEI6_9HYPO|nr:hypothetical protein AK830_g7748 [Neonectria ditissima]
MKVFQFLGADQGFDSRTCPSLSLAPIRPSSQVEAAELCHSDTHVLHGRGAAWMCALPVVLGHEVAGTIVKLSDSELTSTPFRVGDRVAVACVGHPIQKRNFQEALGVGCDGGYAEYVAAPLGNLAKLPDAVGPAEAAVATDSIVMSGYHGLGGQGLNGVAIAALRGAKVYGVDISTTKFDQARDAGAIECATSLDHFSDQSFDVIVDFAGAQATVGAALSTVRNGGTVVLGGLASATVQFTTTDLVTKNISLRGSKSANTREFREMVELLASGALKPQIEEVQY